MAGGRFKTHSVVCFCALVFLVAGARGSSRSRFCGYVYSNSRARFSFQICFYFCFAGFHSVAYSFFGKVLYWNSSRAVGKNKRLGLVNAGVLSAGGPKVSVIASRVLSWRGFSVARLRLRFLVR